MNGSRAPLLLISLVGVSCSAIIGIEEADVDPSLELGGHGGTGAQAGSTAQTGGTAGTSGSAGNGGTAGGGPGGTAGAGTGGSAGAQDDAAAETLCGHFCRVVKTNCVDDGLDVANRVYLNDTVCLAACSAFPEGTAGDMSENTVHCRLENAELAALTGEPTEHCAAAGPGGAGICGSNCEGFCTMLARFCPTSPILANCMAECSNVPDTGFYNTRIQSGDSLSCRLYHVSAATLSAGLHCPHAAGEDICIP